MSKETRKLRKKKNHCIYYNILYKPGWSLLMKQYNDKKTKKKKKRK